MNALLMPAALMVATLSPYRPAASTRLAYQVPAGCPTEPEFRAAVALRGAELADSAATDPARVLAVTIWRQQDGFRGAFQIRDGGGATDKRVASGRSCDEVVDALALVTTIALEGAPSDAPATSAPPPTPAAPPARVAADQPPSAPAPGGDGLRGTTRFAPPRTETIEVGPGPLRFDLSRAAMLYAGAVSGLAPSVFLPRYALTLTSANFVTTPEGLQRISGLVYQVHVDYLGNGTYQSADTRTKIAGVAFGVDFCQSPHYDSRGLVLLLCGEYGGGYLNLATKGLDGATMQSKNAGFGQVSAVIDAQYNLDRHFVLGVRIGGSYTFGDITAERADGSRIFSSSSWSAYAMLGAGVRF
jgi:hypothetical protein